MKTSSSDAGIMKCWPGSFGRIICLLKSLSAAQADHPVAEENRQQTKTWMK